MSKGKILVVDDEADVRELMTVVLETAGYEVNELDCGKGVIDFVAAAPPDLIVLDVTMPVMDGMAVLELLRIDPTARTIPVLMASAQNQESTMRRARDLGANDFLVKPWVDGELEWRVAECLAQAEGRQAA